ncbi:hypothetical protein V6N11_063003 [Hibiscus sabdariffa]|uniref:Uncharacterized protein n=2 Tax=Hibiscus sabdariffa TaxID=183260 RepID=A0ABR2NQE1_9ROSI
MKPSTQAILEDVLVASNGQNGVSCDDFSVDDLFDFTNEECLLEQQLLPEEKEEEEEEEQVPVSLSCSHKRQKLSQEQHLHGGTINFDYTDELAVPADDVASLEWLSHFVEDSFSEHPAAAYPTGTLTEKPKLPEIPVATCFRTPVPGKARSKRSRTGGRGWSLDPSPPLTESSTSSNSSTSSGLSASSPWSVYSSSVPGSAFEPFESLSVEKKQKRRPATESNVGNVSQPTRRCSHCGVTKTPQWRAGPMGAKTLCNACGVRFKSGRLLPEYRPACSPTFSSVLHSNHHRKVLEMRRKKEGSGLAGPGLAPTSVPSFG